MGLRTVAIHKAIVMGRVPLEPYFPFEVGEAAKAFPGLTFFFSSRRRHTSWPRDWSSDVCSSDLEPPRGARQLLLALDDVDRHADRAGMVRDGARSEERRVGKECGCRRRT